MPLCNACGQENRSSARFCWNCAVSLPVSRPNESDRQWLASTLMDGQEAAVAMDTIAPLRPWEMSASYAGPQEKLMEEQIPEAPRLFAGRYRLPVDATPGPMMVVDTMPWRRCWACGSTTNESGESYCTDCGAALEQRSYLARLSAGDSSDTLALATTLVDASASALLPEMIDRVKDNGQSLMVLNDSGRGSVTPPLDETLALGVGAALARLLVALHAEGLALGRITSADLEALAAGKTRLRDAPGLCQIGEGGRAAAERGDLADIAKLLEELTATPRTTQRLDEDDAVAAVAADADSLPTVLREVRTGTISSAPDLAARLQAIVDERTRPTALRQIVGAHTDIGMVRDHNEDSYLTLSMGLDNNNQRQGWGIYIVSDGMGGHAAGEVASSLAIRGAAEVLISAYLAEAIAPDAVYDEAEARKLVRQAVLQGNEAIIAEGRAQGNDMGATMTIALVSGDRAVVGNVGDSRTYLYREGKLRRISKDHSLVMRLVELGQIADEDIYTHPQRNAVLRSLGDKSDVDVDIFTERLHPGDALLLCSDGQWEMTRDPEIERVLARDAAPQATCEALVSAANRAGGEDNITVVMVRFA
ncbi:MAG: PP2C family serine/threonine-protein phosphatase [Chloroflexales bacterium]